MKKLFEDVDWEWDAENDPLDEIIKGFSREDPQWFGFRYPVGKKGNSALKENFRFDLTAFCERMDGALAFLDQIDCGLAGALGQMANI